MEYHPAEAKHFSSHRSKSMCLTFALKTTECEVNPMHTYSEIRNIKFNSTCYPFPK